MARRAIRYLLVLVAVLAGGSSAAPAVAASGHDVDYVIIAGSAGLRWDDLSPSATPTLWRLASHGSIGALSVRSARSPSCPGDGWLTLGAGNFAQRTSTVVADQCPLLTVPIDSPDGIGAHVADQQKVVRVNQGLSWGSRPGALAESVRCTVAVGPGAAVAAARPYGRVDRYLPVLPADPRVALSTCVLSIVDLGAIVGVDPAARSLAVRRADAMMAALVANRPARSLIMVAGLSDTDRGSRLHVAIADGPGYDQGTLTSSSTNRSGYVQLVDIAPTALAALNRPEPTKLFAGRPAERGDDRPVDLAAAVNRIADADREAGAQHRVVGRFFSILAICQLLLFAVMVPLLRRARPGYGPVMPRPLSPRLVRTVEVLLVAASLTIPAALLAGGVPWWRSDHAGLVFTAVTVGLLAVGTAAIMLTPLRRGTLGPIGAVTAIAGLIVGADALTGARLQLNGVAGYSALEGIRYAGLGVIGLGVVLAAVLFGAGCLAHLADRRWRPAVVALVGAVGVILVGSPYAGADAGGAVALTAGVCVAAAMSTGGWLTLARLAWATLAGIAVTVGFALLDLRRPGGQQGSLGRFLDQLRDGTGGPVLHRAGAANVVTALTSPLTLLALGATVFLTLILLRPWGGLKRLFGLFPAVRSGLAGVAVAGVMAGLLAGAGLNGAAAAAATVAPLAALAALRVLGHADDRTVVSASRVGARGVPDIADEPLAPISVRPPAVDVDTDATLAGAPTTATGDVLA